MELNWGILPIKDLVSIILVNFPVIPRRDPIFRYRLFTFGFLTGSLRTNSPFMLLFTYGVSISVRPASLQPSSVARINKASTVLSASFSGSTVLSIK